MSRSAQVSPQRHKNARAARRRGRQERTHKPAHKMILAGLIGSIGLVLILAAAGQWATSADAPPTTDDQRTPHQAKKSAAKSPTHRPAPASTTAGRLARTRQRVERALAQKDIIEARAAVSAFRFELIGQRRAERWRDRAFELTEKIDRCLERIVKADETKIARALENERWSDAAQLIDKLGKLDTTRQHASRLAELKTALARAESGEEVADGSGSLIPDKIGDSPKE